jgi:hypothetical protein
MMKKKLGLFIILFGAIFLVAGIGIYFMPLNYITINNVRQVATPENTRTFRLIFLFVFGGIGLVAFIGGVIALIKGK